MQNHMLSHESNNVCHIRNELYNVFIGGDIK